MKKLIHRMSIKNFILLWMTSLVFCFVILALSLVLSKNKLQSMSARISLASKCLDVSRRLDATILEERREDLLWRVTHKDHFRRDKYGKLKEAERLIRQLHIYSTSSSEKTLIIKIEKSFATYTAGMMADPPPKIEEVSELADKLIQDVKIFGDKNSKQVTETIEASNRLNSLVDVWSLIVTSFAIAMVTVGSIALIKRILPPTRALVRAAEKFAQGDFGERIRGYREDEIGMLCQTFNHMAEDISNLLKDRMNFVAAVVHDLRNPMVVVGGAANRLKKKLPLSNEHVIWLDRILEQVGYLDKLIQDLMDATQIETGKLALQMSEIELTTFVRSIHEFQREMITTHTILFEGRCECFVNLDKERLERVIANLISNAVKYSEPGSTVLLKVEQSESDALIVVKDEGVGIGQDEIHELFQPFKRLARTRKMAKGTGLGLFSAKKIVEAHGGTIRISSESGNGATVQIILPMTRNH